MGRGTRHKDLPGCLLECVDIALNFSVTFVCPSARLSPTFALVCGCVVKVFHSLSLSLRHICLGPKGKSPFNAQVKYVEALDCEKGFAANQTI